MTRWMCAGFVAVLIATAAAQPQSGDLVELDVVAVDRDDRPVIDLRQADFRIKEDGHAVDVKTFSQVTALGTTQPDDARIVTLLMDDIGVPLSGTSPMQQIAPVVLAPMGGGDELSVVRLSNRMDEAFGDLSTARDRIAGYRGGAQPFSWRETPETVLKAVVRIATQLETVDHRRKIILCLGLPLVCDVGEPPVSARRATWEAWVGALAATARANASVYIVDPTGARGGGNMGNGLVQFTGGRIFHDNNFAPAGDAIWREAGHYYLLGYWPPASKHDVHSIDVSVARKGVRIRARQRR